MKNKRLLQFLVLLGVVCCALPALAASVTMNQNHAVTVSWTGSAALSYGGHDPVWTEAAANGSATPSAGPIENASYSTAYANGDVNDTFTGTTSLPATASIGAGLTYLQATASLSVGPGTGDAIIVGLNQSMQGVAPGDFGNLYLQAVNHISLFFQADSDGGDAVLHLSDTLSNMQYSVTGSAPGFLTLTALSDFSANTYSSVPFDGVAQSLLNDTRPVSPLTYVANFSDGVIALITGGDIILTGLAADEIFSLDLDLTSSLSATTSSAVPVPPAVWLFGSGLSGLWMMRRRFARGK